MLDFLQKAKQYLWIFVFVDTVADNVLKFANGMQPQALVGLALVLALLILLANKIK
jgi:hypothetical protein